MAYIANFGAVTWTRPTNGTASTAYFATGFTGWKPARERQTPWVFPGKAGEHRRRLGQDLESGTLVGWVEGNTVAKLKVGMDLVDAEADGVPHTLNLYDVGSGATFAYTSTVVGDLRWDSRGIQPAGAGRYRMGFEIDFKRLQTA